MGVWEQTGNRTYKLKHVALAYASSDTPPASAAPFRLQCSSGIRETVNLSRSGDSFEGTFTLDQYARDETTLLQHIAGTVSRDPGHSRLDDRVPRQTGAVYEASNKRGR